MTDITVKHGIVFDISICYWIDEMIKYDSNRVKEDAGSAEKKGLDGICFLSGLQRKSCQNPLQGKSS